MHIADWDVKYARREPTTDWLATREGLEKYDVVIYGDEKCKKPYCRFPWDAAGRPGRKSGRCVINCFRWNLAWPKNIEEI